MSNKSTAFYRGNHAVLVDFTAEEISSDGAVLLLEKIERKSHYIRDLSEHIPDKRDPLRTTHSIEKLLKQRVYTLMLGYEDANDVQYLKNDPLLKDILEGDLASQPTISRLENSLNKQSIFDLCYTWIDKYVSLLKKPQRSNY